MSVLRRAATSGIWLAAFRAVTQLISWLITIAVARLLSPDDYGLMSLASILTGYIGIFSELGLGAAIVQRPTITDSDNSSNFWFSLMLGCGFALGAFGLAYPTAWLVNEPRVIPITQLIAVLFVISSLMIVPFNILNRDFRFKTIGAIQLCAVATSSLAMLWMAYSGFGVWTLILGTAIQRTASVLLVFAVAGWKPSFHFRFDEVRSFLRFGVNVAGTRSLFYIFQKADVFAIGHVLVTEAVGLYSFAMQLASMPTDKIVSLANQVSFPMFARLQDNPNKIRELYLRTTKYLAMIVSPMFLAGAIWGDEIIGAILGPRWMPVVFLFRALCVSQLFVSMITINDAVQTAQGRANYVLRFYLASVAVMPTSIYVAAHYGLHTVVLPWVTLYPIACVMWTLLTIRRLGISPTRYVHNAVIHVVVSLLIVAGVRLLVMLAISTTRMRVGDAGVLMQEILGAAICYGAYLWMRERLALRELWSLRRS